jgi:hypothetical protein
LCTVKKLTAASLLPNRDPELGCGQIVSILQCLDNPLVRAGTQARGAAAGTALTRAENCTLLSDQLREATDGCTAQKGTAEPFPVTLFDIQATKNPA